MEKGNKEKHFLDKINPIGKIFSDGIYILKGFVIYLSA